MDPDATIRELFDRYGGDGSTADAIHDAIAEGIMNRTLPPGWRLGEERLASLFAVSQLPDQRVHRLDPGNAQHAVGVSDSPVHDRLSRFIAACGVLHVE